MRPGLKRVSPVGVLEGFPAAPRGAYIIGGDPQRRTGIRIFFQRRWGSGEMNSWA